MDDIYVVRRGLVGRASLHGERGRLQGNGKSRQQRDDNKQTDSLGQGTCHRAAVHGVFPPRLTALPLVADLSI